MTMSLWDVGIIGQRCRRISEVSTHLKMSSRNSCAQRVQFVWSLHFMQGNGSTLASYDSRRNRIHSTRFKTRRKIAEDWVCRVAAWRSRREPRVLAGQGTNGPG